MLVAALGCELALDDFGTGFGSFTYLRHLPARYLKIDMEFVRDINTDASDREIVRTIIMIAHTLGKETIAEDVEALQTLRDLGVDHVQGFYTTWDGRRRSCRRTACRTVPPPSPGRSNAVQFLIRDASPTP